MVCKQLRVTTSICIYQPKTGTPRYVVYLLSAVRMALAERQHTRIESLSRLVLAMKRDINVIRDKMRILLKHM